MAKYTAVVTGGSAGIGAGICRYLLDTGYEVISLARRAPELHHPDLLYYEVDLADMENTAAVASEIAGKHDVTALVNNAGVIRPALIEDVELEDLEYLTRLHLGAMITLTQAFLPCDENRRARQDSQYVVEGHRRHAAADQLWRHQVCDGQHDQDVGHGTRAAWHHGECHRAGACRYRYVY